MFFFLLNRLDLLMCLSKWHTCTPFLLFAYPMQFQMSLSNSKIKSSGPTPWLAVRTSFICTSNFYSIIKDIQIHVALIGHLVPWCSISISVCAQTARGRLMDPMDLPWLDLISCSLSACVYTEERVELPADQQSNNSISREHYLLYTPKDKKIHIQTILSLMLWLFARAALRVYSISRPIKKQSTNADGGYKLGICTYTADLHPKSTARRFVLFTVYITKGTSVQIKKKIEII